MLAHNHYKLTFRPQLDSLALSIFTIIKLYFFSRKQHLLCTTYNCKKICRKLWFTQYMIFWVINYNQIKGNQAELFHFNTSLSLCLSLFLSLSLSLSLSLCLSLSVCLSLSLVKMTWIFKIIQGLYLWNLAGINSI